ncbi:MAG: TIR domain-containing protein [Methylocystis sp.]|uniref:toll/interleukin-1 receptor domain-containing protein n=1 Tax=Methylocystis sp. TaxID=1911079 RepID=UPI003DA290E9
MSNIFLSHSSKDDVAAVAVAGWLKDEGWDDIFLDLDPVQGIHAGERWERALYTQAAECGAVLFLVSRSWLGSEWCRREFELSRKLNKRCFIVLIENITIDELPPSLKETHQTVSLAAGEDHLVFRPILPITQQEGYVTFSREGLMRLKIGLEHAGLDPRFFPWPPPNDPNRAPYRGLEALDGVDAGIFFGRDGPITEALDELRGLREATPPRIFVILGASGAGKSSFLRAGLMPRLLRDERNFLTLPVIRPDRLAMSGPGGLIASLSEAAVRRGSTTTRAQIRRAAAEGAASLRPILQGLLMESPQHENPQTIVVTIDQAEELFRSEGKEESEALLGVLRDLTAADAPPFLVIFVIRSDSYDALERSRALEGLKQRTFALLPMPRGVYQTVIEGPLRRLRQAGRKFEIDPGLTEALLEDIEQGGGSDALPLLSFTMELLFRDHEAAGHISRQDYLDFGGLKGSIDAALKRAFAAADMDPRTPRDYDARLTLLRRGFIPWLAGIDPVTKSLRRRVALASQIPQEARPLLDLLVEQRLLTRDVDKETGEATVEPAHEALLRQWGGLKGWLEEDFGRLAALEGVKRAATDWDANARDPAWLAHSGGRLSEADQLDLRPDLSALLDDTDRVYLAQCRRKEQDAREAEEAQRRIEAELEKEKHASLLQRAQFARGIATALFGGLLLSLGFAYWATRERDEAQEQRSIAENQLAAAVVSANDLIRNTVGGIKDISGVPAAKVLEILDIAHDLQEKLSGNGHETADLQRSHALSREAAVQVCLEFGKTDCARKAAEEAVSLRKPIARAKPDDPGLKMELAGALTKMGDVMKFSGDLTRALEVYSEALALKRAAASAAPRNNAWRAEVALGIENVGDVQALKGEKAEAFESYRSAQDDREAIVAADPKNPDWRASLALNDQKVGAVLFDQNDRVSARRSYDAARLLMEGLSREDPHNSRYMELLAESLEKTAGVSLAMNQLDSALDLYRKSLVIRKGLVDDDPGKASWRRELAQLYNKLGDVEMARGEFEEAARNYTAGLSLVRRLALSDETNAGWQTDLSRSLAKIGDVRLANGDFSLALASYRDSLAILRAHPPADPMDVRWEQDIALLNEFVAAILYNQKERAGAVEALRNMADALKDIAKITPGNMEIQLKIVEAYKKLALVDRENVALHTEAALAVLNDLSKRIPRDDFNARRQVDYARTQLGNGRIDLYNLIGRHARLARK